jgi:acid phosphatase
MTRGSTRLRRLVGLSVVGVVVAGIVAVAAGFAGQGNGSGNDRLARINHFVVVYEENHSFDNLYGGWEGVNGLSNADSAHTIQVNQAGNPYSCLKQLDANLTSPPLGTECHDATVGTPGGAFDSHFANGPFTIDTFIPPTAITCPPTLHAFSYPNGLRDPGIDPATNLPVAGALPGGCTRDLVHEFYQEQYQLDGGRQDRYVTGSDSAGTAMGVYDTKQLPVYAYLHSNGHPHYAIADDFFQAAFGGSFLNHQWLIAATTPTFPGAPASLHTILDGNGMPTSYPLYTKTNPDATRGPLTIACPDPVPAGLLCGDYAVNTMRPPYQPSGTFGAQLTVPQTSPTIGDRLSAKGVDWAWYSGGWSNADGDVGGPGWTNDNPAGTQNPVCTDPDTLPGSTYPICPNAVFQFHHQPFNYFSNFAPGTQARTAHLRDEEEFIGLAQSSKKTCDLKPVSFVKPLGQENEHPGYASEPNGSNHLVDDLLKPIENGACSKDTMVIVVYDEFGGQWDHVPPPGQGTATPGPHDQWGPGTRIPALIISPFLRGEFVVDHVEHDTTSILATLEHRYSLAALATRDAAAHDLSSVFDAKERAAS